MYNDNPFMGQPYASGYFNAPTAYLTAPNMMYGPTYGQMNPESWAMMPTPYGGIIRNPVINPYYVSMIQNPVRGFFTYTVPLFMPPKGISPLLYDNYKTELKYETAAQAAGIGITTLTTSIGGRIGGIPGAIIGTMAGMALSGAIGTAAGRVTQIHETANLLNLGTSHSKYGIGISMANAADLYKMFTKEGSTNAHFTSEEYQLTFSELARNGLLDDTLDMTGLKASLRKMKNVVEKLQDLFQDGNIKDIVASLRQLRMIGVSIDDIDSISVGTSVAATVMGQKPTDYLTNAIGQATQMSTPTGLSAPSLVRLKNTINIGVTNYDNIKELTSKFIKGESRKHIAEKLMNLLVGSTTEMSSMGDMLFGMGGMSPQQYIYASLAAGLQEYNKEHNSNISLKEVMVSPELRNKIARDYAPSAMKHLLEKYHGDTQKAVADLTKNDAYFAMTFYNPQALSMATRKINHADKLLINYLTFMAHKENVVDTLTTYFPGRTQQSLKLFEILKKNPNLFQSLEQTKEKKIKEAQVDEEAIKMLSNASLAGKWEKTKQKIQHLLANIAESLTLKPSAPGIVSPFKSNRELSVYYNAFKEFKKPITSSFVGGINPYATLTGDELKATHWWSGFRTFFLGDGRLSNSQRLIGYVTGDWSFTYGIEDMKKVWAYKKASLEAYNVFKKDLVKFAKDPHSDEFEKRYSVYFERLKNLSPFMEGFVSSNLKTQYGMQDKKASEIFKETIRQAKELARALEELKNKTNKTAEDKKRIKELENRFYKTVNSIDTLYQSVNFIGTKMFKDAGKEVTKDNLENLAVTAYKMKNNNEQAYDSIVKGMATKWHVTEKVARHYLDNLAKLGGMIETGGKQKDKAEEILKETAIKSSPVYYGTMPTLVTKNLYAAMSFASSGITEDIAKATSVLGGADKLIQAFNKLSAASKSYGASDTTQDVLNMYALESIDLGKGVNKENKQMVISLFQKLKSNWEDLSGGYAIKIKEGGKEKEIKSFKDFMKLDATGKKEVLQQLITAPLLTTVAGRLDIDPSDITKSPKTLKAFQKLMTGLFTYKDGRFQFKGGLRGAEEFLSKNKDVANFLQSHGIKTTVGGLMKLERAINGDTSTKIDTTNSLLRDIKKELVEINANLSHKIPHVRSKTDGS